MSVSKNTCKKNSFCKDPYYQKFINSACPKIPSNHEFTPFCDDSGTFGNYVVMCPGVDGFGKDGHALAAKDRLQVGHCSLETQKNDKTYHMSDFKAPWLKTWTQDTDVHAGMSLASASRGSMTSNAHLNAPGYHRSGDAYTFSRY